MPDIAAIQAIAGLGATGILIIGIWALAVGRVRSGPQVDGDRERTAEQVDQERQRIEKDRDGWRAIAESALAKLADLTTAIVELTKTIAALRAEVRRLQDMVRDLGGKP